MHRVTTLCERSLIVNKKGESVMNFVTTERSLRHFKRAAYQEMKKLKFDNEYKMIEPYLENAMNRIPEERKELFYLYFDSRLNELEIANKLDLSIPDVMKELDESIVDVLDDAFKLFLTDKDLSKDDNIS